MGHTLYVTSSPSIGTYSPSMLSKKQTQQSVIYSHACMADTISGVTHSEMWTKMSSPPWEGRMNPWPWDLEKFLHTPLNTGPDLARTVLQRKRGHHFTTKIISIYSVYIMVITVFGIQLTLNTCGCVWWAVDLAALQAVAASSPSPRPGYPPSGRGRRAAGECVGRLVAVVGPSVRRRQDLTSWLATGWVFSALGFLQWYKRKKRREGYTSCMTRVCGREGDT